jgi:low temperature requirement protein LtrA
VIVFSIWWLYFDRPAHDLLTSLRRALIWGYGHYLIFASLAAVGVGLAVSVDYDIHVAHVSGVAAGYTVAVPVAVFLLVGWVLHVYPHQRGPVVAAYPVAAVLVLGTPFTPAPVHLTAAVLAALVLITTMVRG